MTTAYNDFSGQSLERVQALTDGVFAVAMTLLVLDVRLPSGAADNSQALWSQLGHLGPSFAAYVLSFTMLGTFWLALHTVSPRGSTGSTTERPALLGGRARRATRATVTTTPDQSPGLDRLDHRKAHTLRWSSPASASEPASRPAQP